jgi:hypothetical protein
VAIDEEDLHVLDVKVKQLKLDYEQYFLGSRPREPGQLRGEVQKLIQLYSSTPIQNTALRFRFNSINSRFQAFKRQWDNILRQIEAGTYKRHVFKADLREKQRGAGGAAPSDAARPATGGDLFASYRDAALACGQDVSKLTPEKLERVISKQRDAVRQKLGCDDVDFRVVVQEGNVKLKAQAARKG